MICFTHTFSIPETQFLYIPVHVMQSLKCLTMQDNSCLLVVTLYSDTGKIKFHVSRQRGNIYLQFIDEGIIYTSLIVYFDELIKVYHPIHRGFKGNNSSGLHLFLQCMNLLNLNFCLSYAYTYTYLSFLYILQCIKMKSTVFRVEI